MHRHIRVVVLCVAALTVAAACSSSSPRSTASSSSTAPAKPTGTPLNLYGIFDLSGAPGTVPYPQAKVGFQAAVNSINNAGGVAGHPINGVTCDAQLTTTASAACAQAAVDGHALAAVISAQLISVMQPILGAAKIPILTVPLSASQLNDPNLYAYGLGPNGGNAAAAVVLHESFKLTKYVYVGVNVPAALAAIPGFNNNNKAHGWPEMPVIMAPYGIPDAAPYAAQVMQSGAQGAVFGVPASDNDKLIVAMRQAGSNMPIIRPSRQTSKKDIDALGSFATNVYTYADFIPVTQTTNPAVKALADGVKALDPSAVLDETIEGAWAGVQLFAKAAKSAKSLENTGIAASLDTNTFDIGFLPTLQFSKPQEGCGLPRCFNTWVAVSKIENGTFVMQNNGAFLQVYGTPATASPK